MTHTKHSGLYKTWTVPIKCKHYYRVFLWDTIEEMESVLGVGDDYFGYAFTMPYTKGETTRLPKKFGEIHLYKERCGVGVVAHEIQHILNYWIVANEFNSDEFDEEIARLAGEMTREYWNGYYV